MFEIVAEHVFLSKAFIKLVVQSRVMKG